MKTITIKISDGVATAIKAKSAAGRITEADLIGRAVRAYQPPMDALDRAAMYRQHRREREAAAAEKWIDDNENLGQVDGTWVDDFGIHYDDSDDIFADIFGTRD